MNPIDRSLRAPIRTKDLGLSFKYYKARILLFGDFATFHMHLKNAFCFLIEES